MVLEQQGRFLVQQRAADVVNGGLWEFPNVEITPGRGAVAGAIRHLTGGTVVQAKKFLGLKHAITRYRITLDAYRLKVVRTRVPADGRARWCSPAQLHRLAFPSAHRRVVEHLQQTSGRSHP